jgi:hypothetical protein
LPPLHRRGIFAISGVYLIPLPWRGWREATGWLFTVLSGAVYADFAKILYFGEKFMIL